MRSQPAGKFTGQRHQPRHCTTDEPTLLSGPFPIPCRAKRARRGRAAIVLAHLRGLLCGRPTAAPVPPPPQLALPKLYFCDFFTLGVGVLPDSQLCSAVRDICAWPAAARAHARQAGTPLWPVFPACLRSAWEEEGAARGSAEQHSDSVMEVVHPVQPFWRTPLHSPPSQPHPNPHTPPPPPPTTYIHAHQPTTQPPTPAGPDGVGAPHHAAPRGRLPLPARATRALACQDRQGGEPGQRAQQRQQR